MAFADHLVHTVEVRRRGGDLDRFQQPVEPSESRPPDATYSGRLTVARGGERFTDRARDVVQATHTLFLPLDAELSEADRVTVRDEYGGILVRHGNVLMVTRPRDWLGEHHIEVQLSAVRSPGDAR